MEGDGKKTGGRDNDASAANRNLDGMPDAVIVTYGMSTEGYELARRAALRGATVFIVDESNPAAILLNADTARRYADASALKEEEPIMPIKPLHEAVAKADYVFFAPRIRTQVHNTKTHAQAHFKDAVEYVEEGSSVIFCVPVGFGENSDYAEILEHDTGLNVGTEVSYYYCPLESGAPPPRLIGSASADAEDERLALLLSPDPAAPAGFTTMYAAEHAHALRMVTRFAGICTMLEMSRFVPEDTRHEIAPDDPMRESYLDGMVGGLLDIHIIEISLENAKSLRRLAYLFGKAVSSYVLWLVENVKQVMRDAELRTTKTRVVILWTFDYNLLRGDHSEMSALLVDRLRDWMAEVEMFEEPPRELLVTDRPVVIIPCSPKDFEKAEAIQRERPSLLIVKANALCERFVSD